MEEKEPQGTLPTDFKALDGLEGQKADLPLGASYWSEQKPSEPQDSPGILDLANEKEAEFQEHMAKQRQEAKAYLDAMTVDDHAQMAILSARYPVEDCTSDAVNERLEALDAGLAALSERLSAMESRTKQAVRDR